MIRSAAGGDEVDGLAAPGLTASYMRLRAQVAELVAGTRLADEFASSFPEIEVIEGQVHPNAARHLAFGAGPVAKEAQGLLRQLAGWIEGLVAEQTFEQRIQAEAAERVRQEKKPPTGFG